MNSPAPFEVFVQRELNEAEWNFSHDGGQVSYEEPLNAELRINARYGLQ